MTGHIVSLIQSYGYPALLVGAFIEGEATVLIAGFLAHSGYLVLPWVFGLAFLGAYVGDQTLFRIGRAGGSAFVARRPKLQVRIHRIHDLLQRYQNPLMLSFRFVYGLRLVTVLAVGISGPSARRFAVLNAIGVMAWAITLASFGYFFGHILETVSGNLRKYELLILLILGIFGGAAWYWHHSRLCRLHAGCPPDDRR
jgi:membrane protein DedA with SNARE-associated domain